MSPVFDCVNAASRADALDKVVAGVRDGDLVVLPTDTVYGIGADAFSPSGVGSLLEAKGRGRDVPPPILIASPDAVDGLATDVPRYARALMKAFWPGPLTLVLWAAPSLMWDIGETHGTVALRMPDQDVALALLERVGPMAVSSANRTGYPASRTIAEAAAQLGPSVEFYLDAGPSTGTLASTIVDATGEEPRFLRVGALSEAQVRAVAQRYLEAPAKKAAAKKATAKKATAKKATAKKATAKKATAKKAPAKKATSTKTAAKATATKKTAAKKTAATRTAAQKATAKKTAAKKAGINGAAAKSTTSTATTPASKKPVASRPAARAAATKAIASKSK